MKPKPQLPDPPEGASFDPEKFITGAAASRAERHPRTKRTQRKTTGGGKMAAPGFRRTSIDLPEGLYEQLKIRAVKERRPLRDCVEEALALWIKNSTA